MGGIERIAGGMIEDLRIKLPWQRKTPRTKLGLLVATMLEVRSANLMDLAASLPRRAERVDMRDQWIERFLANGLVDADAVMAPYVREVFGRLAASGHRLALIIDQTKASDRHQVLMLSVRFGERALPLAWRVRQTQGAIGFADQRAVVTMVAALRPAGVRAVLMGDRFYGSPDLIRLCQALGWDDRLRLKRNLIVLEDGGETTTGACAASGNHALSCRSWDLI